MWGGEHIYTLNISFMYIIFRSKNIFIYTCIISYFHIIYRSIDIFVYLHVFLLHVCETSCRIVLREIMQVV